MRKIIFTAVLVAATFGPRWAMAGTGYAGSPAPEVTTVQGISGGTPMNATLNANTTVQTSTGTVSFSATGDTIVVSSQTAQTIKVYKMILNVNAATILQFKDGVGGGLMGGALSFGPNGNMVLDFDSEPWFVTTSTNSLVINQTGTAQVSGRLWYKEN